MTKPSPLAADTPPQLQKMPLSSKIGLVVGAVLGTLIASAIIVYVTVVVLLGIDLSFEQFIGASLLLTYIRNSA